MKAFFCYFLISMILFTGCTSVHIIQHDESSYNEVNKKVEGKQASITLESGQKIEGKDIRVTIDSTSWVESESHSKQVVPTAEVKEIAIRNREKGGLSSCGLGLLGGAFVGFLWAVWSERRESQKPGYIGEEKEIILLYSTMLGGAVGGGVGLVIGYVKGWTDKYILSTSADSILQDNGE